MKQQIIQYRHDILTFILSAVLTVIVIWTALFCHNSLNGSYSLNMYYPDGYTVRNGYLLDGRIRIENQEETEIILATNSFYNHAVISLEYGDAISSNPTIAIVSRDGERVQRTIEAVKGQTQIEIEGNHKFAISKIVIRTPEAVNVTGIILRPNLFNVKKLALSGLIVMITSVFMVLLRRRVAANPTYQKRESNLELGRVLCMILLIGHHLAIHGGVMSISYMGENRLFALFLLPIGKIAFVFFIACSCWFLVEQPFKAKRFFTTWLQGLFYSVTFFVIACRFGEFELNYRKVLGVFFPILGDSHGFLSAYLAFYLLLPLLQMVSNRIETKKLANYVVAICFTLESLSMLLGVYFEHTQSLRSEVGVFILCYFVAVRLKNWPIKIMENQAVLLLIVVVTWLLLWAARYENAIHPEIWSTGFVIQTLTDECSVTNLVAGYALFFFLKNLKMPRMPFVNYLAQGTLACLLIHDHEFFRYVIWDKFVGVSNMYYASHGRFLLCVVGTMVGVFACSFVVDRIRVIAFERRILKLKCFASICNIVDNIF